MDNLLAVSVNEAILVSMQDILIPKHRFYVYSHSTETDGVFYVGYGTGGRAMSHVGRPLLWRKIVRKSDGFKVSILKSFQRSSDAFKFERNEISRLQPVANSNLKNYHPKVRHKKPKKSEFSAVMRELNARRNKKLSSKRKSEIARNASKARWNKSSKQPTSI